MSNGKGRLFNIILICSLTINLLLLGGLVGRFLNKVPAHSPVPGQLGWIYHQLDKDKRDALKSEFESRIRKARTIRTDIREAQRDFEAALLEPELDRQRLAAALDRLRVASETFQQEMHKQMLDMLMRLNPEERARVAEFLRRRDEGGFGRTRKEDGPSRRDRD